MTFSGRRRKHSFLLRGFAFCNICGRRYTGEIHTAKKKAYYHCAGSRFHTNIRQNIEISILERKVEERFKTIQFSEEFTQLIISKLRAVYGGRRKVAAAEKQVLYNQKKAVELRRDKAEEKLFDGVISDDDFSRVKVKFAEEIAGVQNQIDRLDEQEEVDINVVQEILKLSRNVYEAYVAAPYELKRQYLGLFWDRFLVQDKKIVEAVPTELIEALQQEEKVIIMSKWFPSPPLIITLRDAPYLKAIRTKVENITNWKPDPEAKESFVLSTPDYWERLQMAA